VLLDVMYDVPSRDDIEKIIIEQATVTHSQAPKIVHRGGAGSKERSA